MNITHNLNGSYTISAMINGYRISRTFYGYSKREAIKLFRSEQMGVRA